MCVLLQIKYTDRMQLSNLWQEIVNNHTLFTRMKFRITQCWELQNHHKSSESEILHDHIIIIEITNAMNRYSK